MAPIQQLQDVRFAPLGLTNMLNPGGAILSSRLIPASSAAEGGGALSDEVLSSGSVAAQLAVRGNGSLVVYSSQAPKELQVDGLPRKWQYDVDSGALTVELSLGESVHKQVQILW